MPVNVIFSQDRKIKGLNRGENFSYSVADNVYIFPEEVLSTFDNVDSYYSIVRLAGESNNKIMSISQQSSLGGAYSYTSNIPSIVSIGSAGNIQHILDDHTGEGNYTTPYEITIESDMAGAKRYVEAARTIGGGLVERFASFKAGTLGAHIQSQIEALVNGKTAGTDTTQRYWTTNNADIDAPIAVRNPDCFAAPLGLFGMSCMKGTWPESQASLSLVTQRHALSAHHFGTSVGERVVFMRQDGTFQEVTVLQKTRIVKQGGADTDIGLIYFDADVTGIPVFKVVPKDFEKIYVPSLASSVGAIEFMSVMLIFHDIDGVYRQWTIAHGQDEIIYGEPSEEDVMSYTEIYVSTLKDWQGRIPGGILEGGDSGSPSYLPINGEPILIFHTLGPASSPLLSQYIDEINLEMNTQAGTSQGTYVLQHPDLLEFNTYN